MKTLFILTLFISAAVSGQAKGHTLFKSSGYITDLVTGVTSVDAGYIHTNDTIKCVLLLYKDGPVPLQIKGWVVNSPEIGRWRSDNDNNPHFTNIVRWEKTGGGIASAFLETDKRTPIKEEDIWQFKIKNW